MRGGHIDCVINPKTFLLTTSCPKLVSESRFKQSIFLINNQIMSHFCNSDPATITIVVNTLDGQHPYTVRFPRFSVYLSKTIDIKDGAVCLHDTKYTRETIPYPLILHAPWTLTGGTLYIKTTELFP